MQDQQDQVLPRLLIIDDSRIVRASIIRQVRDKFDVREEPDGEAGWQTLLVDPTIQAVITDIGMPNLDGYGLLERIRTSRLSRINSLPVVVISGDDEPDVHAKAKAAGATDFITKGIGNVELLARMEALTQLSRTQRNLEESRAALANASPVDPESGLSTPTYLHHHGSKEVSLAQRRGRAMAVVLIAIDQFDELLARYGNHVAELVRRKLSQIMATKLRKEDTVAELEPGRFAIVCPSTGINCAAAFAMRLRDGIDCIVMTYRGERIRIHISAGIAATEPTQILSVGELLEVAQRRLAAGQQAGGDRVISVCGEVTPEMVAAFLPPPISVDLLLQRLAATGPDANLRRQLPDAIRTLLPLLELIESEFPTGLPLAALARAAQPVEDNMAAP